MANDTHPGGNVPHKNRLQNSKRLPQKELRRITSPFFQRRGATRKASIRHKLFAEKGLCRQPDFRAGKTCLAKHQHANTPRAKPTIGSRPAWALVDEPLMFYLLPMPTGSEAHRTKPRIMPASGIASCRRHPEKSIGGTRVSTLAVCYCHFNTAPVSALVAMAAYFARQPVV